MGGSSKIRATVMALVMLLHNAVVTMGLVLRSVLTVVRTCARAKQASNSGAVNTESVAQMPPIH